MVDCRDFFWLISAHIGNARSAVKRATAGTPSILTACRGALRRGLCGRSYLPYPRADLPPRYCQKSTKFAGHLPLPYSGFSCDFCSPYKRAAPIHKRRPPCQQSPHTRAVFPICWRRSPMRFHGYHNLHTPTQIPIASASSPYVSADPPYNRQAPKT